jgi:prepilin-type processing-associated H-X9-DG protein
MYRVLGADGKEYGPVTSEVLRQWISQGRANAQTSVKAEGDAEWQFLASVPEFAADFTATPGMAAPSAVPGAPPKTSGMAITSLVLGVLGLFTCGVTSLVGLILGIMALLKVNRSGGRLSGSGLAIAGICVSALFLLMVPVYAAMLLPALAKAKAKAQSIACANNVKQLALGVRMYATDNGDKCPSANTWCDGILKYVGTDKVFKCPGTSVTSRSHYAFNQKLDSLPASKITNPARTVMIFESDSGWNAGGGQELMVRRPRHAQRWIVGFADGHVEQLTQSQLSRLIWDPSP